MSLSEKISQFRKERGLTQEELAQKLYVTRQAVSRWENGETTPGIDMVKLIAIVLEVPISVLMEMPDWDVCQSCGMPLASAEDRAIEADGSKSKDYCKYCYDQGSYTYEATMDELIERCAPFMVQHGGMTLDEAISFMGVMLPGLKRWHTVRENEERYGAEVRARFGDEAMDAANEKLLAMDQKTWDTKEALEADIIEVLAAAMATRDPEGPLSEKLGEMHEQWIRMHWGGGRYNKAAHAGLAQGYLADSRFTEYYDSRAGQGATEFLVQVIQHHCAS